MAKPNNINKISAETRRSIYNMIMSHADFMGVFQGGNYEDQNIVDFLKLDFNPSGSFSLLCK